MIGARSFFISGRHQFLRRHYRISESVAAAAGPGSGSMSHRLADHGLGRLDIVLHDGQDGLHGDCLFAVMPAVVIGGQRDGAVADLCLAGQLGLGGVGHADDVDVPVRYVRDSARVENWGPSMQM